MKKYISAVALFLLFPCSLVLAQHYQPVEQSSTANFAIGNHMIFKTTVNGSFKGLKGTIVFDPKNLAEASFDVSIAVNTISTGIGMRNDHLQDEDYFDAKRFPVITIKSKSVAKAANGQYLLTAALSIKGTTKTITIPFTAVFTDGGYDFAGHFEISRMDYHIGPDNSIDKKVSIGLSVRAK